MVVHFFIAARSTLHGLHTTNIKQISFCSNRYVINSDPYLRPVTLNSDAKHTLILNISPEPEFDCIFFTFDPNFDPIDRPCILILNPDFLNIALNPELLFKPYVTKNTQKYFKSHF